MSFMSYWGKASEAGHDGQSWHPLAYHCLDVAACGQVLLEVQPEWLAILARSSGVPTDSLQPWLVFLLTLHDLGKFADGFQSLRPDLWLELKRRSGPVPAGERHDTLGYEVGMACLPEWLGQAELARRNGQLLSPWLAPITGHHGRPPRSAGSGALLLRNHFPSEVLADACAFVRESRRLLLPDEWPLPAAEADLAERYWRSSWLAAGLAVASDWLGSNTRWFPYFPPKLDLADYWQAVALPQARRAVAESGLAAASAAAFKGIGALFPHIDRPTPLQGWVAAVPVESGPQLFVLEELTGAGKTEAALTLAARLMAAGAGQGLYVALPTMATADAMFDRVRQDAAWRHFFSGEGAQLALAHSADRLKLKLEEMNARDAAYADGEREATTASRDCTAWLADSRKKALLADFGVGTLDQALLGVLPVKHQSLRLLGLAHKILVVDEVHACDSYMGELLARLLQFHAAQGGSAILLSATLPKSQRARYIKVFAEGAGLPFPTPQSNDYPLATQFGAAAFREEHVAARQDVARRVVVDCVEDESAVIERFVAALDHGRCAVWVRNTVADAVGAWRCWNDAYPDRPAILFHARFALTDRLRIGKRVECDFGPGSAPETRRERLVIATQVIEQSLDVDFDDMASDIVPIDLVIQRAGRLQRHRRDAAGNRVDGPDGRGGARLTLLTPPALDTADPKWLPPHLRKTGKVYPDLGKLWLTTRWLADSAHGGFTVPEQARDMIEAVYDEDACLPEGLRDIADRADGARRADRSTARGNLLTFDNGYKPDVLIWEDEGEAPTRLGEATVRVRLAKRAHGGLAPWCDRQTGMDWQLSELSVPARLIAGEYPGDAALLEVARFAMPDEGRYVVIVALEPAGDAWCGTALNASGAAVRVIYSPVTGLTTERKEDDESDL